MKPQNKVRLFDPKPAERSHELSKVKVVRETHGDLSFVDWFNFVLWDCGRGLKHPKDSSRGLHTRSTELNFRVSDGKWTTYGHLRLAFYSFQRKQVRAYVGFQDEPFGRHPTLDGKCEISWLLSESGVVVPALLESIAKMDWKPLKDTGLFKNSFSRAPDEGCYVWSVAGDKA